MVSSVGGKDGGRGGRRKGEDGGRGGKGRRKGREEEGRGRRDRKERYIHVDYKVTYTASTYKGHYLSTRSKK